MILEAMKMEDALRSPARATVREVRAREGDRAFSRMFADSLQCLFAGEDAIVAQGESPLSFTLFTSGITRSPWLALPVSMAT